MEVQVLSCPPVITGLDRFFIFVIFMHEGDDRTNVP